MRGFGPDELLDCYRRGVFPMAEDRDDPRLFVIDPDARAVLPLDRFHVPRRLKKTVRNTPYRVTCDHAFGEVMEACAEPAPGRENTWINDWILDLYTALHERGHAHSIEVMDGERLIGGLYGVSLGGAFFGESMFSRATDVSKIALVHLAARLRLGGFRLLDAQFMTEHLRQFGAEEVPRAEFHKRLKAALDVETDFYASSSAGGSLSGAEALSALSVDSASEAVVGKAGSG